MTAAPLPPEERSTLRKLLETPRAGDAMAAYYALHHPAAKTDLWVHRSAGGRADGFLVRARTGQDLFRPLVVLRAADASSASELLNAAFPSPRPAIFSIPEPLGVWVLPLLSLESTRRILIYRINPTKLEPVINIFVVQSASPDGMPRYEIRAGERLLASAGVNWQSPDWAEIFVQADPAAGGRGYGKSVCAALCRRLLDGGKRVLYLVEEKNAASARIARGLGFEDTGERELLCTGSVPAGPAPRGAA
jgi:hypothetical protein